jgi:hypothetical protein
MAALRLSFLVLVLALSTPAAARPVDRWAQPIAEASARFGVPEVWIRRVMAAESNGRTTLNGRPIRSRAGAMGLMQLMPGTWREMRAAYGLGGDPDDPRDNILAGAAYLRLMYKRFGYPGMFAAYNAGPTRYANHLAKGRRLPAETVAYVANVAGDGPPGPRRDSARPAVQLPPETLFAVLSGGAAAPPIAAAPSPAPDASASLFVPLGASPR